MVIGILEMLGCRRQDFCSPTSANELLNRWRWQHLLPACNGDMLVSSPISIVDAMLYSSREAHAHQERTWAGCSACPGCAKALPGVNCLPPQLCSDIGVDVSVE